MEDHNILKEIREDLEALRTEPCPTDEDTYRERLDRAFVLGKEFSRNETDELRFRDPTVEVPTITEGRSESLLAVTKSWPNRLSLCYVSQRHEDAPLIWNFRGATFLYDSDAVLSYIPVDEILKYLPVK